MPTAACGRRNIARRISYVSRYTPPRYQIMYILNYLVIHLPSQHHRRVWPISEEFHWGTPRPTLRKVPGERMTNLPEAGRRGRATSHPAAVERVSLFIDEAILLSALRLSTDCTRRPTITSCPELCGPTMLEAGSTVRHDEVLENRICFLWRDCLAFYFLV